MRFMLDTHVFLWMISALEKLSQTAKDIIQNPDNTLFISAISGWEIVIKHKLGKLELPDNAGKYLLEQMRMNGIKDIPVLMEHSLKVLDLPDIHKDPFDRMIISQSSVEQIPVISGDQSIAQYNINVIW